MRLDVYYEYELGHRLYFGYWETCEMERYCLVCWNKRNGLQLAEGQVEFSKEPEICGGCGQLLPVVAGMISESSSSRSLFRQEEQPGTGSADAPEMTE